MSLQLFGQVVSHFEDTVIEETQTIKELRTRKKAVKKELRRVKREIRAHKRERRNATVQLRINKDNLTRLVPAQ